LVDELRPAVEKLLRIAYVLEGQLESPAAAAAVRASILESPEAMAAIAAELAAPTRSELRSFGKRLMREKRSPALTGAPLAVRDLHAPTTPRRAARTE
jgi:hypothetical protein